MNDASVGALLRRLRSSTSLIVATFFLLGLAWLISNPPGAAADEPSHYVRMVGLSEGHLLGADLRPGEGPQPGEPGFDRPSLDFDRLRREAGRFSIPGSAPPPVVCNRVHPELPFDCDPTPAVAGRIEAISLHGRTLPGSYFLPAALSRLAHSTNGKLYLGRLGYLLQDTALFAVAVCVAGPMLRGNRREVFLALLLAVPPLLMFQMGTLSPDGTEAMALLAFAALLLRLVVRPDRHVYWLAVALAVVTIVVRDLGAVFVPALTLVVAVAARHRVRAVRLALGPVDVAGIGVVAATLCGAAIWRLTLLYTVSDLHVTGARVRAALDNFGSLALDSFGRVGWHDVPSDTVLTRLWVGAFVALIASLVLRRLAWSVTLGAVGALYVALNLFLWLTLTAVGYFDQEHYTVVLAAAGVLLASCLFPLEGPSGRWAEALEVPVVAIAAAGHLSVYVVNAQRHAHGINAEPLSFRSAQWRPPIGWAASFGLVGVACLMVLALPALARRSEADEAVSA